jgi:TrmH family RNA methyltransferase
MKLDDAKKLHQKKYRSQFAHYLVEGEHLVLELDKALSNKQKKQQAITITLFITEEFENWARKLHSCFSVKVINAKQMSQLSDTKSPQGIVACVPLPDLSNTPIKPNTRTIYLHEIQDPGNLGTILRTLAWFGDFNVMLSPNSVDPFNSKVVRASMGAIFYVPLLLDVSLNDIQSRFTRFAYLDLQGESITHSNFKSYGCYLFGNEARGVPSEALSKMQADAFTIAGSGDIDSLNLASAVTICSHQLSVKQ